MARPTVESCTTINIGDVQKLLYKRVKKDHPGLTPEESLPFLQDELAHFTANSQHFEYEYFQNYFGGYRFFFLCPKCKNKASKLFLPPKHRIEMEARYLCKNCHRLVNECCVKHNNKIYVRVIKPLKRMKLIEQRIEKGHLRADKVQELLDEYEALEKDVKNQPEYRIYLFKKKHEIV